MRRLKACLAIFAAAGALALAAAPGCKKSVGEVRTVDVAADAQGTPARPASVTIDLRAGELRVTPGGAHVVGGAVRSNVGDLDPRVDAIGEQLRVAQGGDGDPSFGPALVADWRLTIGPTPIDLMIDAGRAASILELGGLAIHSLRVKSTDGAVRIAFGAPNPLAAEMLDVDSSGGDVTIDGVARFNAPHVHAHAAKGSIAIDLGAKVDRDVVVDVEADAGSITVKVPAQISARAKVQRAAKGAAADAGGDSVNAAGWTKDGDAFVLGPAGATPRATINVRAAANGAVTLVAS